MDFTFTDDQRAFKESVRDFFLCEVTPELIRTLWMSDTGRSAGLWEKMVTQGFSAVSVPEALGGLGLSEVDWALIAEEAGYFGLPDALCDAAMLAPALLCDAGDEASDLLSGVASGKLRVAVEDPVSRMVEDAHVADLILAERDGSTVAIEPSEVLGHHHASVDRSRRLFKIAPTAPAVGHRSRDSSWADTVSRGALATAAQLAGAASRILDLSVDYTSQRKQFEVPVGSFQAVKHLLANVAVRIEFARPLLYRAAYSMAQHHPFRHVHASHAKLAALDAALLASRNGIQVHGAMGYTWEMDLQIFVKRIWSLATRWGAKAFHKERVKSFLLANTEKLGPGSTFCR